MIEYMADTFYSSLNEILPIIRDAIGASMFLASLSFPFVFFISLFISIKKYKK